MAETDFIDNGVANIAEGLFESSGDDAAVDDDAPVVEDVADDTAPPAVDETAAPVETDPAAPVVVAKPPPQSWAKDKHELWGKLPPEAQDYYAQREQQMLDGLQQYKEHSGFGKQLKDVFTPYQALLQAQGVDEVKATQYMLNAHYRLSNGTPQERAAYMGQLAKSYGIDLASLATQGEAQPVDPVVKQLQEQVGSLTSTLTQRQQAEAQQLRSKVQSEVDAFASDPKNIYFDEIADDIAVFVQAGDTLEKAYEKAVYANPVTRSKELARLQTENEKALREKSVKEAEAARKAKSVNVNSRNTRKAPTDPLGSMDDTLHATLKEIKERVH